MIRWLAVVALGLGLFLIGWPEGACAADRPDKAASESVDLVERWLDRQGAIRAWSADFVQTRSLKTLAQPLTARGRVKFAAPDRFRWELGDPAETLAVRQSNAVLIVYPPLRRAERYPLDATATGPWKDMLALLDAGFPESRTQLESRFRVVSQRETPDGAEITMEPRSARARRMMPRFRVFLGGAALGLRATEMEFADGSRLRNDFTSVVVNPDLDASVFEPELGPEYKVVEPLGRSPR